MKLKILTGTGHSGTNWAAKKLSMPEYNTICLHESKYRYFMTGDLKDNDNINSKCSLQIDVMDHFLQPGDFIENESYRKFWDSLRRLEYKGVGISHDFRPVIIPKLIRVMNDDIALLVRNGVNTVQSMFMMEWRYSEMFNNFLGPMYAEKFFGINKRLDYFDYCCIVWSTCFFTAKEIGEDPGFSLFVFEDIIGTEEGFRRFFKWFCPEAEFDGREIEQTQKHNIGMKNKGPREPRMIWEEWGVDKKEAFKRYCGDAMSYFNYNCCT